MAVSKKMGMPKNQVLRLCNGEVHHADLPQQLLSFIK